MNDSSNLEALTDEQLAVYGFVYAPLTRWRSIDKITLRLESILGQQFGTENVKKEERVVGGYDLVVKQDGEIIVKYKVAPVLDLGTGKQLIQVYFSCIQMADKDSNKTPEDNAKQWTDIAYAAFLPVILGRLPLWAKQAYHELVQKRFMCYNKGMAHDKFPNNLGPATANLGPATAKVESPYARIFKDRKNHGNPLGY